MSAADRHAGARNRVGRSACRPGAGHLGGASRALTQESRADTTVVRHVAGRDRVGTPDIPREQHADREQHHDTPYDEPERPHAVRLFGRTRLPCQ